ncbi:MAG: hypothetical protein FJ319_10950 [SAR202 cluster bacterium]|nr:hypothetical protein [SAR202 cluster bacterium]
MTERTYTESELRLRLYNRMEEMVDALAGRLADDVSPIASGIRMRIEPNDDGTYSIADPAPLQNAIKESTMQLLVEFFNSMIVAMFEEDEAR